MLPFSISLFKEWGGKGSRLYDQDALSKVSETKSQAKQIKKLCRSIVAGIIKRLFSTYCLNGNLTRFTAIDGSVVIDDACSYFLITIGIPSVASGRATYITVGSLLFIRYYRTPLIQLHAK